MLWDLERKLASIRRRANPSHGFEAALRKELSPQPVLSVSAKDTTYHVPLTFFSRPAALATSLVMILCAGTATYAYTSDNVLPDHPLYPVRVSLEQVEEAIAPTPDIHTQVVIKHAARRAKEVQKLADMHRQVTDAQVEKMNQALDKAETDAVNTSSTKWNKFDRELKKVESDHEHIIVDLPDSFFTHEEEPALPSEDVDEPVPDVGLPSDGAFETDPPQGIHSPTDTADVTSSDQRNHAEIKSDDNSTTVPFKRNGRR